MHQIISKTWCPIAHRKQNWIPWMIYGPFMDVHPSKSMDAYRICSCYVEPSSKIWFRETLQDTSILAINPWVFERQVLRSPESCAAMHRCQVGPGERMENSNGLGFSGSKNEGICFKRAWGDVVNTGKLTGVRCPPFDAFVNVRRLDFGFNQRKWWIFGPRGPYIANKKWEITNKHSIKLWAKSMRMWLMWPANMGQLWMQH